MTRLASLVLVVRDLERALAVWEHGLGFARVGEPSDVPSLGARHVFLRAENCLLELVQPHDERSPPGLFLRQRGEGMFAMELRVDDPAQARERVVIALAAEDRAALLHDWLQHLLVRLQAGSFAVSELAVEEVSERALCAWGAGERVDRARHRLYTEVKGVTYHQLALRETAGGWWARIILDV